MASKKRKRKRRQQRAPQQAPATEPAAAEPVAQRRRGTKDGPPPPPWGTFPLSEITVLVALVLLVAGFFTGPPQGAVMLGVGLVLGSLAGLELSAREHFSGYRSHTLLLGGAIGTIVIVAAVVLTELAPLVCFGFGVVAAVAAGVMFARAFRRASGGSLYKFKLWKD